jgi:hypothetical protein
VVRPEDAEGLGPVRGRGRELAALGRGIAHNYEDLNLLQDQRAGLETWLIAPHRLAWLAAPPLVYLALLVAAAGVRRRNADPAAARARRAHSTLVHRLAAVRRKLADPQAQHHTAILDATKQYLGAKLRMAPGALTFADVAPALTRNGVSDADLAALNELFSQCEAGRYAGGIGAAAPDRLIEATLAERVLK